MGSLFWRGSDVTAVAQVWKATITTTTVGHTYIVTLTDQNGDTVAITYVVVSADSTATIVATNFIAAWNASTDPRVAAITATQSGAQVILTADTAGNPFSAAESGTGTWTGAGNTTANVSGGDWSRAVNWSTGSVPVNGDDVVIDARGSSYAITAGLNQSAVTLNSLRVYMGAPAIGTTLGSLAYPLRISATTAKLGMDPLDGSTQSGQNCWINFGTNAVDATVDNGRNNPSSGFAPTMLSGSHASNKLTVNGGVVSWGLRVPAETATVPTIVVNNGKLHTGSALAYATATVHIGTVIMENGDLTSTLNIWGGEVTVEGSIALDTVNCYGGTLYPNMRQSGADIDDLNMRGGTVNFTENQTDFNVDGLNLFEGGKIILSNASQGTYTAIATDFTDGCNLVVSIGK